MISLTDGATKAAAVRIILVFLEKVTVGSESVGVAEVTLTTQVV